MAGSSKTITFTVVNDAKLSGGLIAKSAAATPHTNNPTPLRRRVNPQPPVHAAAAGSAANRRFNRSRRFSRSRPCTPQPPKPVVVNAPTAVITTMDTSVTLGHAVHVNALKTTLKTGDVLGREV
jgi:hypothetical protein